MLREAGDGKILDLQDCFPGGLRLAVRIKLGHVATNHQTRHIDRLQFVRRMAGDNAAVARLDGVGLACDLVVYIFKTPTGGSTLADLLRSEPPKVARSVETLRRWGASAVEPGRAS